MRGWISCREALADRRDLPAHVIERRARRQAAEHLDRSARSPLVPPGFNRSGVHTRLLIGNAKSRGMTPTTV